MGPSIFNVRPLLASHNEHNASLLKKHPHFPKE
jgi:hypothetical protein